MYIYILKYLHKNININIANLFIILYSILVSSHLLSHKFYNCQFHKFVSKSRSLIFQIQLKGKERLSVYFRLIESSIFIVFIQKFDETILYYLFCKIVSYSRKMYFGVTKAIIITN